MKLKSIAVALLAGALFYCLGAPTYAQYSASSSVSAQDTSSTSTVTIYGQTIITGASTVSSSTALPGLSAGVREGSVFCQITGTWTGTLQTEVSMDGGTTWYPRGLHLIGSAVNTSSTTVNCAGLLNVDGMTNFRVRATAAMTGTAYVAVTQTQSIDSSFIANTISTVVAGTSLANYEFASAGTTTLTGYFVNGVGVQVIGGGSPANGLYTLTITSTPVIFSSVTGGTLPPGAVGFTGVTSGSNCYYARGGSTYAPGAGFPYLVTGNIYNFGQVTN